MTQEQINTLARYFGCMMSCNYTTDGCTYTGKLRVYWLNKMPIEGTESPHDEFEIYLSPLSSLTQEDFDRMVKELNISGYRANLSLHEFLHVHGLGWNEADWLRNNGYYLGEESIKEFVKLQE